MLDRVDVEVSTNGVIDGEMDSVLAVDDSNVSFEVEDG